MCREAPCSSKGEWCQGMVYPYAFWVESIFAKSCVSTHERTLRCTKYGLWTRQMKMIGQRKLGRNAPWKQFKPPQVRAQRLSLRVSLCVYHMYCSLFPPNKYLTCFSKKKKKKKWRNIYINYPHDYTMPLQKIFSKKTLLWKMLTILKIEERGEQHRKNID